MTESNRLILDGKIRSILRREKGKIYDVSNGRKSLVS